MRTICVFLLVTGSVLEVSPVQKVIELLDGLKGKVEAELESEASLMEEFSKYCDTENNSREDAITSQSRTITDLAAVIQDSGASAGALKDETDGLGSKISATEGDLEAATAIRTKERTDFEAREKELVETIDTLERAVIVLKRGQTFLQKGSGAMSKDMALLASSLQAIVSATWVNSKQRQVVQQLLQADDESEDLSLQPQASVAAYESKGAGIVETLQDMQTKAEASLGDARKGEMETSHQFEMLRQGLETESATMTKRMSVASQERTSKEEAMHAAQGDQKATEASLATDKTFLKELTQSCRTKQQEWETRQKDAAEEMAAIAKAREVLSNGVKVFLQASVTSGPDSAARSQVVDLIRGLASKDHADRYALTQLLQAAGSDPFGKVRGMIQGLIDRLLAEAGEESDAKAFCDTEQAKSKEKQRDLAAKVDRHAVRIEKTEAAKAKLADEIRTLQTEVTEIDAGVSEATKLREKEHSAFAEASAEYRASADAVAQAMEVLQEYYSNGSFLQTGSTQAPDFGGAKTDVASTILGMLEVAESDFTRLLAESEAAENTAASAFSKLSQDSKVSRAAKLEETKGKESEVKSLDLGLLNYKEDHASTSKELDAVLSYLDKLKPQCETKVMSFAERTARREQEIAGLKEALTILEAS